MTSTNSSSKFTPFSLPLSNGATLTGISYIPSLSKWKGGPNRPLIVAIHGGTCTAYNFDINPEYTLSTESENTGIPVVSIDRPCYGGTTSFLPLDQSEEPNKHTFFQETASWLHNYILPVIWADFATPNSCTSLVLLSHSLGVPISVIAGALYARTPPDERRYVLSGAILTGFGAPSTQRTPMQELPPVAEVSIPVEVKRAVMLADLALKAADPALTELVDAQTVPAPIDELRDGVKLWPSYWTNYAADFEVPVLYRMGEHDLFWLSDEASRKLFSDEFAKCKRFDSAEVPGASHALEWSFIAPQWYKELFRFASEVSK